MNHASSSAMSARVNAGDVVLRCPGNFSSPGSGARGASFNNSFNFIKICSSDFCYL